MRIKPDAKYLDSTRPRNPIPGRFCRILTGLLWHGTREAIINPDPPNWEFFIPVEISKAWNKRKGI